MAQWLKKLGEVNLLEKKILELSCHLTYLKSNSDLVS